MRVVRWVFLLAVAAFFIVPQLAMARFAFQSVPVALLTPATLTKGWSGSSLLQALTEPAMWEAARISLLLAGLAVALNLALLLPLSIVTEIRAPHLKGTLSALTLLPWVIPPVALVVGVAATFRAAAPWFLASPLSLVPFYALWAMPFTYRSLDAGLRSIGARTLYEAARSMGASFPTVVLRVIVPNLGASVVAAAGLTAALVLGEFAFASLLLKQTLPTFLADYQRSDPRAGMALALAVLLLTALALGAVVQALRRRGLALQTTGI